MSAISKTKSNNACEEFQYVSARDLHFDINYQVCDINSFVMFVSLSSWYACFTITGFACALSMHYAISRFMVGMLLCTLWVFFNGIYKKKILSKRKLPEIWQFMLKSLFRLLMFSIMINEIVDWKTPISITNKLFTHKLKLKFVWKFPFVQHS